MDSSIISGLIGGLVAVVLGAYISKSVKKARIEGELGFGAFMLILGFSCLAFVLLAVWAFFNDADAWEKPSELYSIVGLFVGFGFGAVYSFAEYFKVRGKFDDNGIDFQTPWTGQKSEKWNDLEKVKLNGAASWYVLYFKSGKKIRLSTYLSGHGEVLDIIKAKGYDF